MNPISQPLKVLQRRLAIGACMAVLGAGALTAQAADASAVPAPAAAAPAAHWVARQLDYTYMGFTTKFTCDGLRDSVREVLLALGARKQDLDIRSRGCTRFNGVEPFPGVSARFSVLAPLNADEAGKVADTARLATQWRAVDLVRQSRSGSNDAPCELLEQLKDKALPLFSSRNLQFHSACVPHEVNLGQITFSVEVLKPAPAPAAAAPAT